LAHVYFGRDIIEVATFRAATAPSPGQETLPDADADPDADEESQTDREDAEVAEPANAEVFGDADTERLFDKTGRIIYDNVYGSVDEDVWRRDFTANALYYNIADFSLWDYVGGAEDIAARRLKLIGDPDTRYREDPVRMLRAARFEAKLGFELDPATAEPLARLRGRLADVPPARLFDETLKLFLNGCGVRGLEVLRRRGLLAALLPTVDAYLESDRGASAEALLVRGLANTDLRVSDGKPVTPSFLFALLLYGPIARLIEAAPPERWHDVATILDACDRAVRDAQKHVLIPRRFSLGLREMFALQPRLEHPRGRRALRVLEHPRFRAAYDLLQLRAQAGLAPQERADWWKRLQEVSAAEREQMLAALEGQAAPRPAGARRGARSRRRPRSAPPA
jgi:poly(A) polymerase